MKKKTLLNRVSLFIVGIGLAVPLIYNAGNLTA